MSTTGNRAVVLSGLDNFLRDPDRWLGASSRPWRVGILANPVSITSDYEHVIDACVRHPRFDVVRLFGPEHGIRGDAQDMIEVDEDRDPITGIPTVSLYGSTFDSLTPQAAQLDGLDVLLIDLQDVGSRYYTFIATGLLAARAAWQSGVRVVVLDRINPIADLVEGPSVDPGYESFVGLFALPIRHGLTMAEVFAWCQRYSDFFVSTPGATPIVVPATGWHRSQYFDETTLPWVMPSPNMPTVDTAVVYPGQCLLEGTNLNEGRGCTRPFEIFGAPWVDPRAILKQLQGVALPGAVLRPLAFLPTFHKWHPQRCGGFQLHVTDRQSFRPVLTSTALLWAIRRDCPDFAWRTHAYEFVDTIPAIDLLFGSDRPRRAIDAGADWSDLCRLLDTPAELTRQIQAVRLPEYGSAP
jgi:uncharacterized protein YbbC (DUF1343 family)